MELTNKNSFKRPKVKAITTSDNNTAFVRVISGKERDEWMSAIKVEQDKPEHSTCEAIYCPLLVRALCDEKGNRIFEDKDAAQFAADTDSKLLEELFNAALEWNRITKDEAEQAKKN